MRLVQLRGQYSLLLLAEPESLIVLSLLFLGSVHFQLDIPHLLLYNFFDEANFAVFWGKTTLHSQSACSLQIMKGQVEVSQVREALGSLSQNHRHKSELLVPQSGSVVVELFQDFGELDYS